MSLPGKLCLGIIEEDNPLRSYFRFKPLLIENEGRFEPWQEAQQFPSDGCIRIVPDKNESYHFKARMRRIGPFCAVDLRAHPEENDKIRPNKNYREEGEERNAYIIYSDVVKEIAPHAVFELLSAAETRLDAPCPRPLTGSVLLTDDAQAPLPAQYDWTAAAEDESQGLFTMSERTCDAGDLQCFTLPGFHDATLRFAVLTPERILPAEPAEEKPEAPEAPAPAREPVRAAEAPAPEPAHAKERKPRVEPRPVQNPEKPWIHHDSSVLPKPVDPRLSPAQRLMAEQAGLNPRRGRSLQELIDEKWQHSRLNQLGHPVAPLPTGMPVSSPVDAAVEAVRAVWEQPNLRAPLLESLIGIDDFGPSLETSQEAAQRKAAEERLNALEAQRLELLSGLDRLKANTADVKQALKAEIRQDEAAEFADAVAKTAAARAKQRECEAQAEKANSLARDAQKALDALTGEQLEARIRELALNRRILDALEPARREPKPEAKPARIELQDADIAELLRRVTDRFAAEGWSLTPLEAANLCVCAGLSPALILSGPVGSGKTAAARMLADALGWTQAGRLILPHSHGKGARHGERCEFQPPRDGAPAMLLLDDANLRPGGIARELATVRENPEWLLCATVQDPSAGQPIPANVLDAGFMLRLSPDTSADWHPRRRVAPAVEAPVSLRRAFEALLPQPEEAVPTACAMGLDRLRKALQEMNCAPSRRAMEDAWNYCGVMRACLGEDADPDALLDRAIAQRILPPLLACAPVEALRALPAILREHPVSRALLRQPLPIEI